jgi:sulfoxide reductase heme-binding subunit YedZ
MEVVDISSVIGLMAMGILTLNLLMGMLLGTAYKTNPVYKKLPARLKKASLYKLHNYTAYVALLLVLLHPVLLLFDAATKFTWVDILLPINAPHQKFWVCLGALALFAVVLVVVTSQKAVKKRMTFRTWKNIHLVSYVTACLFLVHGLVMDPELKDRPVDWLDGEKLLVELCMLVLICATFLRVKYHLNKQAKLGAKRVVLN